MILYHHPGIWNQPATTGSIFNQEFGIQFNREESPPSSLTTCVSVRRRYTSAPIKTRRDRIAEPATPIKDILMVLLFNLRGDIKFRIIFLRFTEFGIEAKIQNQNLMNPVIQHSRLVVRKIGSYVNLKAID